MTTAKDALAEILAACNVDADPSRCGLIGDDPVLPTTFRICTAAGASIAAIGVLANELWVMRGLRAQQLTVDLDAVALAIRGEHNYIRNGALPPEVCHEVSGFFPTADIGGFSFTATFRASGRE